MTEAVNNKFYAREMIQKMYKAWSYIKRLALDW